MDSPEDDDVGLKEMPEGPEMISTPTEAPPPRTLKFQRHRPPPISTLSPTLESPMQSARSSMSMDFESTIGSYALSTDYEHNDAMTPISLLAPDGDTHGMHHYFRPWKTRLFDCSEDIRSCLSTLLLPCITFPQVTEIINEGQTMWWEHGVLCTCLAYKTFGYAAILYIWLYRLKMRHRFNLRGNHIWDCFLTHFCCYLVICQMQRELQHYGFQTSIGWRANIEKHGARIKKHQQQRELEVVQAWKASCRVPPIVPDGMFRS